MIKPMFGHRPKPKRFELPLRYHNPEKELPRSERIRIERPDRARHEGQPRRVLVYAGLLLFVFWVISRL
ncbi:MAG: hypothetical protein WD115_02475 [Balneolaceae bacterium]